MDLTIDLTQDQRRIIELPTDRLVFLEGPAGAGKTTTAVERMISLMAQGVSASSILILLPQRTLADPYYKALSYPGVISGGAVTIITLGGLAQRMVNLFWPLVAEPAGFGNPGGQPVFLTLETAQYYMAHLVSPLLDQGYFSSVTIERNRLYSQIIDNLNKAAVVGFPIVEIGDRLKEAWNGEPAQLRVYDDVQDCVGRFRRYCLENNLLDFSLQMEVFRQFLWNSGICRQYLRETFRHIIYDNVEEDPPVIHDLIQQWLPDLESALVVYDIGGGMRSFLGADPASAYSLKSQCSEAVTFHQTFVMSSEVEQLAAGLNGLIEAGGHFDQNKSKNNFKPGKSARLALNFEPRRFYPDMLDWVAGQIQGLLQDKEVSASDIVILAPYVSDALQFSLLTRLEALGIPARSHRPSRALRDEPAARCMLTLSCLAYPEWGYAPARADVVYALFQSISGYDLIRSQLLAEIAYRIKDGQPVLSSFDQINSESQSRITFSAGERYEQLRAWLKNRREPPDEFDHFLSRLFGELLSQAGFGFHADRRAGEVTANLIESVQKFRWVAGDSLRKEGLPLGSEYFRMVQSGVLAAQYMRSWVEIEADSVLIAPAFTFLLANRPVRYQFWLDAGSRGWFERLDQPLTHPHVLSRNWNRGRRWNEDDELAASYQLLRCLVNGLLHRCQEGVFLGLSEMGEQGYEQRGPLLQVIQRFLRIVE